MSHAQFSRHNELFEGPQNTKQDHHLHVQYRSLNAKVFKAFGTVIMSYIQRDQGSNKHIARLNCLIGDTHQITLQKPGLQAGIDMLTHNEIAVGDGIRVFNVVSGVYHSQ